MTNPKTDHKSKKPTTSEHSGASRAAATAPERQTNASVAMIEACDRLGQKLDEVTGLVRQQVEAWRQIRPSAAPPAEGTSHAGPRAQESPPDESASAAPTDAPGSGGLAATSEGANRLVDTLARSRNGWQEQAAGVQQTLEAIMAYLEGQAAATATKVDVDGIMSRLRDLEASQQSLQSQFNTNR